jgi:acyl-CoA thioester hydrolase
MSIETFRHQHRVTYADCTVGNHVYYARYLDLLEAARAAFFRSVDLSFLQLQEAGFIFPVIEVRLRYRTPARYDDVLEIEVWPTVVERVRLNFSYVVRLPTGKQTLEGETFHVCTGLNEKPLRLPEQLTRALRPYLPEIAGAPAR